MKTENIKISLIQNNKGQIDGLPSNPRTIKRGDLDRLKKSLTESPEMLNLRELIVYPYEGKYIAIGGNQRLRAARALGFKELPCKVLPADTPIEKLQEYTIKDNHGYGEDDFDQLANEWVEHTSSKWKRKPKRQREQKPKPSKQ